LAERQALAQEAAVQPGIAERQGLRVRPSPRLEGGDLRLERGQPPGTVWEWVSGRAMGDGLPRKPPPIKP